MKITVIQTNGSTHKVTENKPKPSLENGAVEAMLRRVREQQDRNFQVSFFNFMSLKFPWFQKDICHRNVENGQLDLLFIRITELKYSCSIGFS